MRMRLARLAQPYASLRARRLASPSDLANAFFGGRAFATEDRRAQLSRDLEFCCFSYAYAAPCATCPFPEDQRPEPEDQQSSLGGDAEDLRRACACLGLDHRRLGDTSHEELRAAFHEIAFASHPDTAAEPSAADPKLFQRAFTSYSLLRAHVR